MVYLTKRFYMYNFIQMLPYFCSDIDYRWHQKGAKTKNVAQGNSSVCHWVSQEDLSNLFLTVFIFCRKSCALKMLINVIACSRHSIALYQPYHSLQWLLLNKPCMLQGELFTVPKNQQIEGKLGTTQRFNHSMIVNREEYIMHRKQPRASWGYFLN